MKAFRKVLARICLGAIGLGLLLMLAGTGMSGIIGGYAMNKEDLVEINEQFTGVENIYLNVDYGELRIEKGEQFSIRGTDIYKEAFSANVDGGSWSITYNMKKHGFWNLWGGRGSIHSILVVTVPEQKLGTFDLNMGAGKCVLQTAEGEDIRIHLGAGSLTADRIYADKKLKIDVGAGEAVVRDARAAEAELSSGAGRIDFAGEIMEKGRVDCGAGEVTLKLDGSEEEYGFSGSCGIGAIEINGTKKAGIASVEINRQAPRQLQLSCGVGKIKVDMMRP